MTPGSWPSNLPGATIQTGQTHQAFVETDSLVPLSGDGVGRTFRVMWEGGEGAKGRNIAFVCFCYLYKGFFQGLVNRCE